MRRALAFVVLVLLAASLPAASGVGTRYATYVGSDAYDHLEDMAVDGAGNVLVVGKENHVDGQGHLLFVKKYDPDGRLLWRSVIGNTGDQIYPHAIAVDGAGNGYVVGFTQGGMPFTDGSFQPLNHGETDAFVLQVMSHGAWGRATMLGGSSYDLASGVDVDADGNVYVVGETYSCDFPTTSGAYQPRSTICGEADAFVVKLAAGLRALSYGTHLGGSGWEGAVDVAVSRSSGSALVVGHTVSPDFDVTSGGRQRTLGGEVDGFVVKVASDGRSLLFGTYVGGTGRDYVSAVTRDGSSNVYIAGETESRDFPTTPGAHQTAHNGRGGAANESCASDACFDGFVAKLDPYGSTFRYATLFGGADNDNADDVSIDATGTAYVAGFTASDDFPAIDGRGAEDEWMNAVAVAVTPNGNALAYSTVLSGEEPASARAIHARGDGSAWVAGRADGDIDTTADADRREAVLYEGFLVELDPPASQLVFAPRGGNEWWVETALGGREANLVAKVEARDNNTGWTTLPKQAWGAWGGTLHVEPGHDVQYRVTLSNGVVRQSCWLDHPATTCAAGPAFDAGFSGVKGNEWWVEAKVSGNQPVSQVEANVNGGAWKALTLRSWGAWAASFHVPEGSVVQLRATSSSGATDLSGCYRWTAATSVACGDGGGGTEPGSFDATFRNVRGNEWWVETDVSVSGGTLAGVDARVNGGAWIPLEKRSWGSWAESMHAPAGSTVEFRARSTDGQEDVSSAYRWPPA